VSADDLDRYRATAREWLAANLERRQPESSLRAHDVTADEVAAGRAAQTRVYDAGYLGIAIDTEYGGQGLTQAHQQIWNEESSDYAVPAPGGIATGVTIGIIVPTLLKFASEEQKRTWIPRMLSGEEIWVQLLSEPGAGSDLAGVLTRATRDGDSWVLNGNKVWSSGALVADYGVCLARTDWDVAKHRGLTWFKVPLGDSRVTVRPVREINGSSEFCEEFLDDVLVGDDMVIGQVNEGWPIANTMLAFERGGGARRHGGVAGVGGTAKRELAPDLVSLAAARGLAGDPAIRQQIARAHINDYMQSQLSHRVMAAMASGAVDGASASLIKLGLGVVQPIRAQLALDIAGRSGIAWEPGDEAASAPAVDYLNGRIMAIAGGSNQIQRNIISERLLGLPREPSVDGDKPFSEVLRDARNYGAGSGAKAESKSP
jgi:alkylation response protein AidB-like acyl-CoA dehydrogenase